VKERGASIAGRRGPQSFVYLSEGGGMGHEQLFTAIL